MTRPGPARQRRGSPRPATRDTGSDRDRGVSVGDVKDLPVHVVPGSGPVAAAAIGRGETRVDSVIDFLDRRWTTAEADAAAARRSLLLLLGVAVAVAVVAVSIAVAAAGFVVLLMFAQARLSLDTTQVAATVLATVGAGGATVAVYQRLARRGRRRTDG